MTAEALTLFDGLALLGSLPESSAEGSTGGTRGGLRGPKLFDRRKVDDLAASRSEGVGA